MNNSIAFIFTNGPHSMSSGREGLDALLSISSISKNIGVFFISDGILLLLPNQCPDKILARNFIVTFYALSLYDVNKIYCCFDSALNRGLDLNENWVLKIKWVSIKNWRKYLSNYRIILTF